MKRFVALMLLGAPVLAAAMGDTGWVTITGSNLQIISDGSPRVFVYVTVNNGGCSNSIPELIMDGTNPLASAMYATLLTAKATGQSVDIATSGCSSGIGSPIIVGIYLGT